MNKLTIPSILAATVLIAGIFAFMPVEKASTVHTGLGDKLTAIQDDVDKLTAIQDDVTFIKTNSAQYRTEWLTDDDPNAIDVYTLSCDKNYTVLGINVGMATDVADNGFTVTVDGVTVTLRDVERDLIGASRHILIQENIVALASEDVVLTSEGDNVPEGAETSVGISLLTSIDTMCSLLETTPDTTNGN